MFNTGLYFKLSLLIQATLILKYSHNVVDVAHVLSVVIIVDNVNIINIVNVEDDVINLA